MPGVNLFVRDAETAVDREAYAAYARRLADDAAAYGLELDPEPVSDDDAWADKPALMRERPVPVVSFTFALTAAQDITALRRAGSTTLASVTTLDEARAAQEAGIDGLIVQGSSPVDTARPGTPGARSATRGGRAGRCRRRAAAAHRRVRRLDRLHEGALAAPDAAAAVTVVTRALTGRPARSLRTRFVELHDTYAPVAYPAVHHLTRELRRRATQPETPTACTCRPAPATATPLPVPPVASSSDSAGL